MLLFSDILSEPGMLRFAFLFSGIKGHPKNVLILSTHNINSWGDSYQ